MAKAAAISAIEQPVVTVPSQSHKIQNFSFKVSNGVDQSTAQPLKQKSTAVFDLPQIIPRGMDELQDHINLGFKPFGLKDDGYSSSDFFAATPKESAASHVEVESSDTVIMPVMVTDAANIKEKLGGMKATLDRLLQESAEKDAQIKHQNEQIAELMKKVEKKSYEASNKGSCDEDSDKESNHDEDSDDERD